MIGGHFDLSVGAIVGLSGWAMYLFGQELGLPPAVTVFCSLGLGTMLGFLNGIIQVNTGLSSFIVTLATALMYRGSSRCRPAAFPW